MENLYICKSVYYKACEEQDESETALAIVNQDSHSSMTNRDKLVRNSKLKRQAGVKAKERYIMQLELVNKYRSVHYKRKC